MRGCLAVDHIMAGWVQKPHASCSTHPCSRLLTWAIGSGPALPALRALHVERVGSRQPHAGAQPVWHGLRRLCLPLNHRGHGLSAWAPACTTRQAHRYTDTNLVRSGFCGIKRLAPLAAVASGAGHRPAWTPAGTHMPMAAPNLGSTVLGRARWSHLCTWAPCMCLSMPRGAAGARSAPGRWRRRALGVHGGAVQHGGQVHHLLRHLWPALGVHACVPHSAHVA